MKDKVKLGLGAASIFVISEITIRSNRWLWLILSIVIMFLIVAITPICRCYESIWIFLLTIVLTLPVNISIMRSVMDVGILELEMPLGKVLNAIEIYLPLLSIEEVMVGMVGRMIFPKQLCLSIQE